MLRDIFLECNMSQVELTVPRSYAELSIKQVKYIAHLQLSGETAENICTKCFIGFSGIRPVAKVNDIYFFVKKKMKGFFSITSDQVAFFSKKMDWVNKSYAGIQPPQIGRYLPCDKYMRDTNFIQYLEAENYYQAYLFKKEDVFLHKLMAVLYQRGDKYNNSRIDKLAKYFKRRPMFEKHITLMWMVGLKTYFARKYKFLFARTSAEDGEDDQEALPDMAEIINNQLRILTEGDVTKRKLVLSTNTVDALSELNEKCREYLELKNKK